MSKQIIIYKLNLSSFHLFIPGHLLSIHIFLLIQLNCCNLINYKNLISFKVKKNLPLVESMYPKKSVFKFIFKIMDHKCFHKYAWYLLKWMTYIALKKQNTWKLKIFKKLVNRR